VYLKLQKSSLVTSSGPSLYEYGIDTDCASGSTILPYTVPIAATLKIDYTLSEAWSGVNWADLMAAQGAFGTDFYDLPER